jgi:hypothetical protein
VALVSASEMTTYSNVAPASRLSRCSGPSDPGTKAAEAESPEPSEDPGQYQPPAEVEDSSTSIPHPSEGQRQGKPHFCKQTFGNDRLVLDRFIMGIWMLSKVRRFLKLIKFNN